MRSSAISMLAAALLAALAHAAAPNMKEGLWEITARMEMAGMPAPMPPQTMQQCITKKELEDPGKTAPGSQQDPRCKIADYKLQGNTASWKMACQGEGAMSGSGSITYSGTSYSGVNKMTMSHGGQAQNMTMTYSGRHIGECKK